eukprot:2105508-Prymnesium_polylepis.1
MCRVRAQRSSAFHSEGTRRRMNGTTSLSVRLHPASVRSYRFFDEQPWDEALKHRVVDDGGDMITTHGARSARGVQRMSGCTARPGPVVLRWCGDVLQPARGELAINPFPAVVIQ